MAHYDHTKHCYTDNNNGNRIPHCDFCGTTDKDHGIRQMPTPKGSRPVYLCNNPVCNALGKKAEPKPRRDGGRRPSARRRGRRASSLATTEPSSSTK